ncbi:MAG TPA: pilus assembly protein [Chloroflexota bacterium]|nr:pilus assembly protein [Chloroflexota bacterium]
MKTGLIERFAPRRQRALRARKPGQGMMEYALVLAGVATIVIMAIDRFDAAIGALLSRIAASLS